VSGEGGWKGRFDRHLKALGAAFLFAMVAYGIVHLIYWSGRVFFGWAPN
jgi:hypothetical protein